MNPRMPVPLPCPPRLRKDGSYPGFQAALLRAVLPFSIGLFFFQTPPDFWFLASRRALMLHLSHHCKRR